MKRLDSSLAVLLIATGGCAVGGGEGPAGGDEVSPACLEADEHSDLEWIESEVFATGCAGFSSCHQGSAPSAGGLNLEPGMAFDNLIGVESAVATGMNLVEPGDPANSYLLVILGHYGADDPRIDPSIGTMPANNEMLCGEKRSAIERWIARL